MFIRRAILLFLIATATAWGQTAQAAPPPSSESPFVETRQLLARGQYDEAIANLKSLEERNPALEGLASELGVAYYKKGDADGELENGAYRRPALQPLRRQAASFGR